MWDEHTDAPYEGPPYYFLNVLQWINGWDADRTDISAMYGKDGYMVAETLQSGTPVVNKDAVGDAVIWRDSRTRDLVIADPVKEVLETFDTASVWYRDLEI
ncbi:MAG TPA: hypothetical protein DDY29_08015 [Rhodobacteraceae bacterium]|nr:hypothetical protein [Paracoccaceae bacterium]